MLVRSYDEARVPSYTDRVCFITHAEDLFRVSRYQAFEAGVER